MPRIRKFPETRRHGKKMGAKKSLVCIFLPPSFCLPLFIWTVVAVQILDWLAALLHWVPLWLFQMTCLGSSSFIRFSSSFLGSVRADGTRQSGHQRKSQQKATKETKDEIGKETVLFPSSKFSLRFLRYLLFKVFPSFLGSVRVRLHPPGGRRPNGPGQFPATSEFPLCTATRLWDIADETDSREADRWAKASRRIK